MRRAGGKVGSPRPAASMEWLPVAAEAGVLGGRNMEVRAGKAKCRKRVPDGQ